MDCNMELWAKQTFSSEVISFRIFHSNKTKNTGDTMGNNSEEMSYIFKCKRGSWMDAKYCSLCYLISSNSLLTLKPKHESRCEQLWSHNKELLLNILCTIRHDYGYRDIGKEVSRCITP